MTKRFVYRYCLNKGDSEAAEQNKGASVTVNKPGCREPSSRDALADERSY